MSEAYNSTTTAKNCLPQAKNRIPLPVNWLSGAKNRLPEFKKSTPLTFWVQTLLLASKKLTARGGEIDSLMPNKDFHSARPDSQRPEIRVPQPKFAFRMPKIDFHCPEIDSQEPKIDPRGPKIYSIEILGPRSTCWGQILTPRCLKFTPECRIKTPRDLKIHYQSKNSPSTGQKSTFIARKLTLSGQKLNPRGPKIDFIDILSHKSTPWDHKLTHRGLKLTPRYLIKTPRISDSTSIGKKFDYQSQKSPSTSQKSNSIARKLSLRGPKSTSRVPKIDTIDNMSPKSTPWGQKSTPQTPKIYSQMPNKDF